MYEKEDKDMTKKSKKTEKAAEKITLETLKNSMCKWPIGDPQHDDFHFCGEDREAGASYCQQRISEAYRVGSGSRTYNGSDEQSA